MSDVVGIYRREDGSEVTIDSEFLSLPYSVQGAIMAGARPWSPPANPHYRRYYIPQSDWECVIGTSIELRAVYLIDGEEVDENTFMQAREKGFKFFVDSDGEVRCSVKHESLEEYADGVRYWLKLVREGLWEQGILKAES